ncbi:MAG: Lipopolysaccharide assembly protein B [Bacteroidia bacterium]|nr:Lipopolysaccharide assembly protein B [Bacteroidia bacterium]
MTKNIFLLLTFNLVLLTCLAQPGKYSTDSKRAINLYETALDYYNGRADEQAKNTLLKALDVDDKFLEARIMLADIYVELDEYEQAVAQYRKVVSINPDFFPNAYYILGNIQLQIGKYDDAKTSLENFLQLKNTKPETREKAKRAILTAEFGSEAIKKPVPFDPKNLGAGVNTADAEYFPALTADEQTIVITRNSRPAGGGHGQEDFYESRLADGEWTTARNLGAPLNTPDNEGAQTISPDGQLMFFTGCNRQDGLGGCDIYFSRKVGNAWTEPQNIRNPINSSKWESQPSLSPDKRTVYFASSRSGGKGDKDIWSSTLTEQGVWGVPVNLGDAINTPGQEESPFIHPDNQTLYFSSDGHLGMGRKDIYYSRKDALGNWQKPVNLGYPINTWNNDDSFIVGASGKTAYFASDRKGGFGSLDLYSFELYEAARPTMVTYVKGNVFASDTKKPLVAKFELIDLETNVVVVESSSNSEKGEFLVSLPVNKNYALNVSKEGYLFYSENFSLKDIKDITKPYQLNVGLQPVKTGEKVILKNIFFETNSFQLKEESTAELQKLLGLMQKNKNLKIEIGGHTDNVGDDKSNQLLSENRAKSVYEYLTTNGIVAERLSYKGFGETTPIATNDTEEGRAQNRRTEFTVIGNN